MNSALKERFARLGPVQDVTPGRCGSPVVLLLRPGAELARHRRIDAIHALVSGGTTMLRAKRAVEQALEQGRAVIELPHVESPPDLQMALGAAGFVARILAPPGEVDVAALRARLDMTREQFALAFGFSVETVRNWEAGRREPGPALAYLHAIANDPDAVLDAYAGERAGVP